MKRLLTILTLLLFAVALTACGTPTTDTPPPAEPTEIPPTDPPLPEIGEIVVEADAELTQETCAGFPPILGGEMTALVSTTDSTDDAIGKVEFYIEDEMLHTATESPFGFSADLNEYEDDTEFTLRVDVYNLSGNLHQSNSSILKVDNTPKANLKELSTVSDIDVGGLIQDNVSDYRIPWDEEDYLSAFCQNFTFLINHVGMWDTQIRQGEWDFTKADELVEFAEANNLKVRGFPLIYADDLDEFDPFVDWTLTPRWVHEGDYSREEMIEIMCEHIETVMLHYEDTINEWIVVNEALWSSETTEIILKNTVWTNKLGQDYVEKAFECARRTDPDATLILNENTADYIGQGKIYGAQFRVDALYNYVAGLVEKGTPIDAVGFQFHLYISNEGNFPPTDNPSVEDIVNNFKRYGELGLNVHITELDVAIEKPINPEKLEEQARIYGIVMQACLESEYCKSLAFWGHSDRHNWYQGYNPDYENSPLLFYDDMQPKPAFYSIIEVMESYVEK